MFVDRVLSIARRRLVTINASALLTDAACLLGNSDVNLVIVCDSDGAMMGVITKTDVVRQIGHCQGRACTSTAAKVMTRDVTKCRPGDSLHDVWSLMNERGIQCVPITGADSIPCGVLNAPDALQALLTEVEDEEVLLRDYVMGIGYR